MSQEEATAVSIFEAEINEELETEDGAELSLAERALARKKNQKIEALRYGNLKWIPPTSNIAERLFSKVRHDFSDYRKSLLPVNLESQVFISVNVRFWSVKTVNTVLSS